jgi:hypothetical protein
VEDTPEAEEFFVQVLQTNKRLLGYDHFDSLSSMGCLAVTYRDRRRWKEAEELEVHVVQLRKRVLGVEHPDTLSSMGNLALMYWNQGQ